MTDAVEHWLPARVRFAAEKTLARPVGEALHVSGPGRAGA
jgi:hypothetical protein